MQLWHVLNRGVDKRTIFTDDEDRIRFVHDLYQFNDTRPAWNTDRNVDHSRIHGLRNRVFQAANMERTCLVDVHAWCLMRNHYHLLLSERIEGGLSLFIRKLSVGYANYFNERHTRSGTLFQGRTKRVPITEQAHFAHIVHYIHLNPLDTKSAYANWRTGLIPASPALEVLDSYRWSSYLDYCNIKNFPSILEPSLCLRDTLDYRKQLASYLKAHTKHDLNLLTLER